MVCPWEEPAVCPWEEPAPLLSRSQVALQVLVNVQRVTSHAFRRLFLLLLCAVLQLLDIAHPKFWMDGNGLHPKPFTKITAEDVRNGIWTPVQEDHKVGQFGLFR